jgi:hypothetical protein
MQHLGARLTKALKRHLRTVVRQPQESRDEDPVAEDLFDDVKLDDRCLPMPGFVDVRGSGTKSLLVVGPCASTSPTSHSPPSMAVFAYSSDRISRMRGS